MRTLTKELAVDSSGRCLLVGGAPLHAVSEQETLRAIDRAIRTRERGFICASNVHVMMEARRDERLRSALGAASLVVPDGMPLVWALRIAGFGLAGRVYGPALLEAALALGTERGWRHFFYGGQNGTASGLIQAVRERWPDAVIAGHEEPPQQEAGHREPCEVIERMNGARPDIVWVGLGAPKQEIWMADHRGGLDAPVLVGVGQAFDIIAGRTARAPIWMQRNGLEWLFRLYQEPRRLWRRYLRHNPAFLVILLKAYAATRANGR